MLTCYTTQKENSIPIIPIKAEDFPKWLHIHSVFIKNWVAANRFTAKADSICLIPDAEGNLSKVLFGVKDLEDFWSFGLLPLALPEGKYYFTAIEDPQQLSQAVIAWGLGAYQFTRYKKPRKTPAQLVLPEHTPQQLSENIVAAIYLVRDLINIPAEDLGPVQLAQAAVDLGQRFDAKVTQIIGDDLLQQNYPMIHAVGRASAQAPRLVDLRWGATDAPKVTLVGKGVCFDTGGLDIKNASGMQLMKKDMAGAAHVLGLAQMIMGANLPVQLRVLIPAVENVVGGNAYRPGDIIPTRKGLNIEISNTDAEGRLVLCEALTEGAAEKPDLMLDFATLTGAARVAVGTEISALFSNNDMLADALLLHAKQQQDPLCRLPLYQPYRKMLDSSCADLLNAPSSSYAGAITAALFLQEFVANDIPWAHFDLMAWNLATRPGHPEGGEAMGLQAVFSYLVQKFNIVA